MASKHDLGFNQLNQAFSEVYIALFTDVFNPIFHL